MTDNKAGNSDNKGGASLKRRELLMMAVGAGIALVLPVSALARGAKWVAAGKADHFVLNQPQKVVLPDAAGIIWVTRTAKDKITAVSAVCTHKGGIVAYDEASKLLVCPYHAAAFQPDGKNARGTRKHPEEKLPALAAVPIKESKGEVMVDVSGFAPAAAPAAKPA